MRVLRSLLLALTGLHLTDMSIVTKTYYFGHDIEFRDQDILDNVMMALSKDILNPSVSVNTKKEDYRLHEGKDRYTSEIKITYDSSDDITVDDYDIVTAINNAIDSFIVF